jgi:hypothetical protein
MSVRSWAVGVASTAAVVAGLVGIQSGIAGTAALPILPHRAVAPAPAGGAELPAPAEVSAPPPSAGTVQQATVVRAEVTQRSAPDRPGRGAGKPDKSGNDGGDKAGEDPGRDSGKDSGKDSDRKSDHGPGRESGADSGGGPSKG